MDLDATLVEIWRYPVKSLRGEQLTRAAIEGRGIVGDRGWAVTTAEHKLGSGKSTRRFRRIDGLLELCARTSREVVSVGDGLTTHAAGSNAADAWLTARLGRPVTLRPETTVSHHDDAPLHLVTTSSLAWLTERLGPTTVDVRRFRPNLVIDTGEVADLVERSWVGRTVRVGDVTVEITHATPRCRMVTLDQPSGLAHDPAVLETLARGSDACLGVYARVRTGGAVQLGDPVTVGA